ncbi:hypothetical protein ND748_09970 [Frankia sp. AiPs1]|uniref:hypothetical protein n=1 Tax=Frankia sp. AiPs1 TaxID=573493 RepID=UPI002043CD85|nr:hypothetical protein [Frankia sp. AiPs1]MCM3921984.1 hypothetical protein [Frankia sp. AiPs1]
MISGSGRVRDFLDLISPENVEAEGVRGRIVAEGVGLLMLSVLVGVGALVGLPCGRPVVGVLVGLCVAGGLLVSWLAWTIAFYVRRGRRDRQAQRGGGGPAGIG